MEMSALWRSRSWSRLRRTRLVTCLRVWDRISVHLVPLTGNMCPLISLSSWVSCPYTHSMRLGVWKLRCQWLILLGLVVLDYTLVWPQVLQIRQVHQIMLIWWSCPCRLRVIHRVRCSVSTMPTVMTLKSRVLSSLFLAIAQCLMEMLELSSPGCRWLVPLLLVQKWVRLSSPGLSVWRHVSTSHDDVIKRGFGVFFVWVLIQWILIWT